ncbi:uncharacterized protein LOC127239742 [Andrographis paniculata]|uniref:uncharacterized protein LOC127239742 n=1 Tax=Andrographis paniculata TaxID=175694 RepID=UPI0021E7AF55|nr:uncharacterized protein LOC127239742 [Andrographis paniculata]
MAVVSAARKILSSSSAPLIRRSVIAGEHGGLVAYSTSSQNSNKKLKEDRLASVVDAVNDRKLPPELRGQRNNVRSETDIINVVEQRVWHAMEEGQFENLPGKGKPLDLNSNPHADPAEDTLYRILNKNGCAPEWVELNKEIRNNISTWRSNLTKAWMDCKSMCEDDPKWLKLSDALKLQLRDLNNKVFRYNLIVPSGRQMFGFKWEKEIDRLKAQLQKET